MADQAAKHDDPGMKSLATSVLWFFGVWVTYDMAAFATGMPRQLTPLIALSVAIIVYRALRGQVVQSISAFQTTTSDLSPNGHAAR